MHKGLGSQRLVALFAGGWVLFNFPLLGLWDRDATVWGVPAFPAALFLLWLALIVVLAWLVDRPSVRDEEAQPSVAHPASSTPAQTTTEPAPPPQA